MKIKTDFVTNSSAYDSVEIIIDNPVLLEVLQKYKEMGWFIGDDRFSVGTYNDGNTPPEINYLDNENTKTPAIDFKEDWGDFGEQEFLESNTNMLESLLEGLIIKAMENINHHLSMEMLDLHVFDLLIIELLARKEEINQAYNKVVVEKGIAYMNQSEQIWKYTYDPINGESNTYEEEGEIPDNW